MIPPYHTTSHNTDPFDTFTPLFGVIFITTLYQKTLVRGLFVLHRAISLLVASKVSKGLIGLSSSMSVLFFLDRITSIVVGI